MSTVGSPHFIYIYRNILSIAKTSFVGRVRVLELMLRKQENRKEYEHVSVQSIIEIYLTDTTHRPCGGLSYTISTPPLLFRH